MEPDLDKVAAMGGRGAIVTAAAAAGSAHDFESRFFDAGTRTEDPVTGSAHGALAPFWRSRLGSSRTHFTAIQRSAREGRLAVELNVEDRRVLVAGEAVVVERGGRLADLRR